MRDFDKELYPNTYNYVKDNIVEGVRCNRCGTTVLKSEVEGYTFQSCREYSNEGENFYLLGGWDNDRVFVVRPRRIEDIGSLIVVLCELGDFRNCEFIRIERYDETIQEITEEINNYRNRFI